MNNQFYKNYISTHYGNVVKNIDVSQEKRFYVWKSYLEKLLPRNKGIRILEIGSAMGHNLHSLNKLGYKNVLGVDYSSECVEFCKTKGFNSLLTEETDNFYQIHQKQFDLVVLYDVLEHYLPSDGCDLLINIRSILKDDGMLIISLPNANYPFNLRLLYADITHKFLYNEVSLSQLLRHCGFNHNEFFQINSFTTYDNNFIKYLFKKYILVVISFLGELFWKIIGLSQGTILKECKPTLLCRAKKK